MINRDYPEAETNTESNSRRHFFMSVNVAMALFISVLSLLILSERPSFAHRGIQPEGTEIADAILNNRIVSEDKQLFDADSEKASEGSDRALSELLFESAGAKTDKSGPDVNKSLCTTPDNTTVKSEKLRQGDAAIEQQAQLKPVESAVASVKAVTTVMRQAINTAALLPKEDETSAALPASGDITKKNEQPSHANSNLSASPSPKAKSASKPQAIAASGLSWPVDGLIYSTFNASRGKNRRHGAIDIVTKKGTPIASAMDGIVAVASDGGRLFRGYGKIVIINHSNGLHTVYAHCDKILVKMGQRVKRGEFIATVGRTGRATTDHVHFEVRVAGVRRDPLKYLPDRPHMVKALNYKSKTSKN